MFNFAVSSGNDKVVKDISPSLNFSLSLTVLLTLCSIPCLVQASSIDTVDVLLNSELSNAVESDQQIIDPIDSEQEDSIFFGAESSWRGYVAGNYRHFFKEGLYPGQIQDDGSAILTPEYSLTWPGGNYFVFTPYAQLDSSDDERTHFDIRELFATQVGDSYEFSLGVKKIFWGVTESLNIVDVINQNDFVAMSNLDEKLGQPMANLTLINDWGTIDLFILPYFREMTFAGSSGRVRFPLPLDSDRTVYESSAEEYHVDFAARYSHYIDELEFGISYFKGTSREPDFRVGDFIQIAPGTDPIPTIIYPYYYQMDQVGLDVQYILGGWLLKAEIINRQSNVVDYTASVTGFEYTFTTVFGSEADLSIISEWLYDDRGEQSTSIFENDIMGAVRLALNDINSSEITLALIRDLDEPTSLFSIEASRRVTDHLKLNLDLYIWFDVPTNDLLYYVRDDDYVSAKLSYYF